MKLNSTTIIWNSCTWSGIMSLHSVHWNLMAVIPSISMWSITFQFYVIYHLPYVWSINFHTYVIYHLPDLCELSSSMSMWPITFHTCVIYHLPHLCDLYLPYLCDLSSSTSVRSINTQRFTHLHKALYCVTCKFWICCFVLVICTEMWSTALELPFRGCTCTTACCCMYCWRTLICCSSWFSKMSVCGASGWFRICITEPTLTLSLTAVLYIGCTYDFIPKRIIMYIYIHIDNKDTYFIF